MGATCCWKVEPHPHSQTQPQPQQHPLQLPFSVLLNSALSDWFRMNATHLNVQTYRPISGFEELPQTLQDILLADIRFTCQEMQVVVSKVQEQEKNPGQNLQQTTVIVHMVYWLQQLYEARDSKHAFLLSQEERSLTLQTMSVLLTSMQTQEDKYKAPPVARSESSSDLIKPSPSSAISAISSIPSTSSPSCSSTFSSLCRG